MKKIAAVAVLIVFGFVGPVAAEDAGGPVLGLTLASAQDGAKLTISSTAFQNNGRIADAYAQVGPPDGTHSLTGSNRTPPLTWSAGPAKTRSYVLLMEDPGVKGPLPSVHWVIYDIPANVTSLPEAIASGARTPFGAVQGLNATKGNEYRGPRPPKGETRFYHFEIFAMDKTMGLDPTKTDRDTLIEAMKGHVLASGEAIGTYSKS